MNRREYFRVDNWSGSFYELALELGPSGDDALALQALRALWSRPEVRGPWRVWSDFDTDPITPSSTDEYRLYGCLRLDDGAEVGCMSHLIRVEGESDFLDLSIPIGMLELRFPVSHPLDVATNPWMVRFDERLARIGAAIYGAAPFRLGLLGEEASGVSSAAALTAHDCERGGFLVPAPLWRRLGPKRQPMRLANGLSYVPFRGHGPSDAH